MNLGKVCDLIEIDKLIGLGMKDKSGAVYDNHSISSRGVMAQAVVYQVIVIKEQYVQEKEVKKVVEVSRKKVTMTQEKEVEIVEVIEIDDEKKEKAEQSSKEVVEVKEEKKEEKDVKLEEELITFREKPWANLRKKIVNKQNRQIPQPIPDSRTPCQMRTESPQEPGLCLLEINAHIRRAMEEIDEFLKGKLFAT